MFRISYKKKNRLFFANIVWSPIFISAFENINDDPWHFLLIKLLSLILYIILNTNSCKRLSFALIVFQELLHIMYQLAQFSNFLHQTYVRKSLSI
jgi:hypothetical protein